MTSEYSSGEEGEEGGVGYNRIPESFERFCKASDNYMNEVNRKIQEISQIKSKKDYKSKISVLKDKHPFLLNHKIDKRTSHKKIFRMNYKSIINELQMCKEILQDGSNNPNYISRSQLKKITKYLQKKLCPLIKHAQSGKTGLCISEMIDSLKKGNIIICITKNTLDANEQWTHRALKCLKEEFPGKKIRDLVMVLSSKNNINNNDITHCKTVNDALIGIYEKGINVIFACSHTIRLTDIYKIISSPFNKEYKKTFDIQYDECHNDKEGIPVHKTIIESLLMLKSLNKMLLCTATPENLWDDTDEEDELSNFTLFIKESIMPNSIDFSNFDKLKSDDPAYSSLIDSELIEYDNDMNLNNLNMRTGAPKRVSLETLIRCYGKEYCVKPNKKTWFNEKVIDEETGKKKLIQLRGKKLLINVVTKLIQTSELGMPQICSMFRNEEEAYINGITSLHKIIPNIIGFPKKGTYGPLNKLASECTIHIISTPCRVCLTRSLQEYGINLPYNPYILGKYGGKNILMYKNETNEIINEDVSNIMGEGEFNEQLYKLIDSKNIKTRPLICIGNYEQTGESITFVNNKYGIVNSVSILVSLGATKDYQRACRLCYKTTGFTDERMLRHDKYLIGSNCSIKNALQVEKDKDDHIDILKEGGYPNSSQIENIYHENSKNNSSINGTKSIPVAVTVMDPDNESVSRLKEIFNMKNRTKYLTEIMELLIKAYKDGSIEFHDKTGKLIEEWNKGINPFKINQNKCYKKGLLNKKGYWKFNSYKDNYDLDHNNIMQVDKKKPNLKYDCDILVCLHKYVSDDGSESNPPNRWWLVYKY